MGLSAEEWHIVSIVVFPALSTLGITASIFISSSNNRTLLAMGVIFSAGVLLSAALVHMLPHASETLDVYFAGEDSHDDHESHALEATDDHAGHDHGVDTDEHVEFEEHPDHDDVVAVVHDDHDDHDDHDGHDHLRLMRWLQDDHDDHGDDPHAGHIHAFPWGQTIFSIAFLFLLCVEATMERFIDIYFAGRKGNFFHINDEDEELMYAQGYAAEHERLQKERAEKEKQEKEDGLKKEPSHPVSDMPPLKEEDGNENEETKETKSESVQPSAPAEAEVKLHTNGEHQADNHTHCGHGHGHEHDHASHDEGQAKSNNQSNGTEQAKATEEMPQDAPKEQKTEKTAVCGTPDIPAAAAAPKDTVSDNATDELSAETDHDEKVDTQPVAKPPGPGANIKIPFPDCKECQISYDMPLADCKDCTLFSQEDLGYEDPELFHRHHHHNNLHKKKRAGSQSQDGGSEGGLPGDLRWRAPRRMSGTSNVSGKSSTWGKTAARPQVVSYGVTAPIDEPEQQQTINPWVSILLTLVLSIHVILEGLTIGSSSDVETVRKTFVAVATHKVFAAFSLGSSLVASGYWESNRTMFFVLSGIFVAVDIISIGIGMGIGKAFEENNSIVGAVFQALLGGSFLFVSTVELIPGELEKMRKHNLPLLPILMSLCTGFAVMTLLSKWGV